jgi:hypothetical protein
VALLLEPWPESQLVLRRPEQLRHLLGVLEAVVQDKKDFHLYVGERMVLAK